MKAMKPAQPENMAFWSRLLERLQRFPRLFDRIRWKLTFSYALVSVVLILVLIVLVAGGAIWFVSQFYFPYIPTKMAEQAELIAPYFSDEDSRKENLSIWLDTQKRYTIEGAFFDEPLESDLVLNETNRLHILDDKKRLLGSSDASLVSAVQLELTPREEAILDTVLAGQRENRLAVSSWFPLRVFSSVPIVLDSRVVGSIVVTQDYEVFGEGFSFLLFCLVIISFLAMLVGTLFGFINSRGLTQRLKRVEHATSAWRQGDFTSRVHDASRDELGLLTQRLNDMAEDLASHINTRQELAMLEERNRLALELHDSVKQQVFAIGMKLGFAESLTDDAALKKTLFELGELAHQTQDELQRLIHELKPIELEHDSLNNALETYINSWADLHNIELNHQLDLRERLASLTEQALFRVAQESLANVAKHAQAQHVRLKLRKTDNTVVLNIQDDGRGFNPKDVTSGLGRHSMLERMKQLGGSLKISSEVGQGTEVEARLPLTKEAE